MPLYMEAMAAKAVVAEEARKESLYHIARQMVSGGFAFIAVDARDVDEELLGELVELSDCYEDADGVFVELSNGTTVPFEALVAA